MTVNEYNKWKAGGKVFKFRDIIRFWKTNPSDEQESLRSSISQVAMLVGASWGLVVGFLLGVILL